MKMLPSFFVSQGLPMMAIEDSPARQFLNDWSTQNGTPSAILIVSSRWESIGGPAAIPGI